MNSKNSGPVRQLSFTNTDNHKKVLKSQFSDDLSNICHNSDLSCNNSSLNTRKQILYSDKPPPTKLAWADNNNEKAKLEKHNNNKSEEGIIAKKCKEIKRPVTAKLVKQSSLPKDSLLLSHQQLAERLRQAWKDREKSKQNLNIFLAQNVKERSEEDHNNDVTDTDSMIINHDNQAFDKLFNKPKVILPLKTDLKPNNEIDYKQIFQKRLRRTFSVDEQLKYNEHFPSRSDFKRSVVIIPWQENKNIKKVKENPAQVKVDADEIDLCVPKIDQQFQDVKIKEELINSTENNCNMEISTSSKDPSKPIDVIIRPLTANSKREGFRNRTNTAFNESNNFEKIKPPLVRASSVPAKSSQSRIKFVPVKRKIKSAAKRKSKNDKLQNAIETVCTDDDEESNSNVINKRYQKNVSFSGTEVITMMSLISPEQSDAEEQEEADIEIQKPDPTLTAKPKLDENIEKSQQTRTLNLRKTVKSVSFQQSSIHAVRSFSASFPARRGSIATTLMINSEESTKNLINNTQEKRNTADNMHNNSAREPKRRLLRSKSVASENSAKEEAETKDEINTSKYKKIHQPSNSLENDNETEHEKLITGEMPLQTDSQFPDISKTKNPINTTLEGAKEKQCWDTFCKMNKKGVNISFDTILRGMLTPTEYRLRRKSIASFTDNISDSNTENINDT